MSTNLPLRKEPGEKPGSPRIRKSGWLWTERISLALGLCFLLVFAGFRLQQNDAAEAGLAVFYQQAGAATLAESGTSPGTQSVTGSEFPIDTSPNLELWSEKRIAEYRDSLLQESEPPLGLLRIERLDIKVPIYNGTDDFILNRGVGRIKGTARIDGNGNLGIAGHRDGFFRGLKDIEQGDVLELQTIHGEVRYRVASMTIVDPSDVSVLAPTEERTITLVTCYPFYFVGHAPRRFIVRATAEPQIAFNE